MIVVVGEALIDIVLDADGDTTETPGGSPLNVAVGLARLEVPATLVAQVGHDEHAELLLRHVESSGATFTAVPTSSGRSSTAKATLDATGAASYVFDIEWTLPRQELPACQGLHVGSLGTILEPGRESVRDLVEQAVERDLFVSFDANLRESFVDDRDAAWALVQDLGSRCTLVKLSDEDALLLRPDADPDAVARDLLAGGRTQLVLLTRGPRARRRSSRAVRSTARPDRSRSSTPSAPATPSWPRRSRSCTTWASWSRPRRACRPTRSGWPGWWPARSSTPP